MKICSKCKTPMTSICQTGETFKFCPRCGGSIIEDDLYNTLPEAYKDPYGTWKVTHKQKNGATKILGTFKGFLDEVALYFSKAIDCCEDSPLILSKVEETILPSSSSEMFEMVDVYLDVNPAFNNAAPDSKTEALKKILATRPVEVISNKATSKIIYTGVPTNDLPKQSIEVTSETFAQAFTSLTDGTELILTENIILTEPLQLNTSNSKVYINGQGHMIDARGIISETPANLLTIVGATLDIKDITIYAGKSSKSVIHLYNTPDQNIIDNVTIIKNGGVGSGIVINGVKALFKGVNTITLPTTGWQGLDIDQGSGVVTVPQVTFDDSSELRFNCANPEIPAIKIGEGVKTSDYREIVISNAPSVIVTADSITVA